MPVEIHNEQISEYLDYYKDAERYKIPGRDPEEYNVADNFFSNISYARNSLEKLLKDIRFPEPKNALEQDIYAEFTVTGHAKVRKAPGQQEDIKVIVGQSAMMLERGEEGTDAALKQNNYADKNAVVFTSDLPRAIHHALLKYRSKLKEELDGIADEIQKAMGNNEGDIIKEKRLQLVELALNNGTIPTPLLRSHYHGPRDLLPESPKDWEKFDVDLFLKSKRRKDLYKGKSDSEVKAMLQELKELAKTGKAPFQLVEENGKPLTENLPLYAFRVTYLAELFSPGKRFYDKIKGRRINFVGHSSNIDVLSSYYRHFESGDVVLRKADKSETRGKELVVKVGRWDNKEFVYLNDAQRLYQLKQKATDEIKKLRGRSMDVLIKETAEEISESPFILEIPLVGFREAKRKDKREDDYEPYPETLNSALRSTDPIIIFGHGGQGKSILSTEIARRFLQRQFGEEYRNYVPIMLNCKGLNTDARTNKDAYGSARIEELLRKSIDEQKLPRALLEEYNFVFIIDDYQKLSSDYTKEMENAITKLRKEGNLVILLSRLERADVHPPHNKGYKTMQVNTEGVAQQTDEFIRGRIADKDTERFKDYLKQYDPSIKGHYLTNLFLTMIFPTENGGITGVTDYVINPSIQDAIKKGKTLTKTQLYDAQTDYQSGKDIEKLYPEWNLEKVRQTIVDWKNQLAEKAFNDIFGKDDNNRK